jgi:hypothetical protein
MITSALQRNPLGPKLSSSNRTNGLGCITASFRNVASFFKLTNEEKYPTHQFNDTLPKKKL